MRKSLFLLLLASLCGVLSVMAQEQSLVTIHKLSGNDLQAAVESLGKLAFNDGDVCLISKSGDVLACEPCSNVRSISFVDTTLVSALPNLQNSSKGITIFPNPTVDFIRIQGLETPTTVRVFDLQGRVCKSFFITDDETKCSVADIPQGVYYLQINTNILKLIKQ